jgi:enoyl-CoA hydratase/carnithine racemase
LIALGELVTSEDALRLGLVSRVFPKGRFEEDARGFARALAGVPARAMDRLLALCRAESAAGEEDAVRAGWEAFRDVAPWLQQGGGTTPPVAAPADR